MLERLCVFCGSRAGRRPEYLDAARRVGRLLGERGIGVVYGGGRVGLMGAVADAALAAGGEVLGIIPEALTAREVAHQGLTELLVVSSMHERKQKMAALSQAFLALPGGFGTFEEFSEVLTWTQLELHHKPCGLLNTAGYYDPLLALYDRAASEGFLRLDHRRLVLTGTDPELLLGELAARAPAAGEAAGAPRGT